MYVNAWFGDGLGDINSWCYLHLEGDGNKVKCNVVIMAVYGDSALLPIWSNGILIEIVSIYSTAVALAQRAAIANRFTVCSVKKVKMANISVKKYRSLHPPPLLFFPRSCILQLKIPVFDNKSLKGKMK